jgi:hypothetical protein
MWNCSRTQTTKYTDVNTSGCTRVANCGKKAVFVPGTPEDGDSDSTEQCDWYPCVQADPSTHECLASMCVSKRVFQTVRSTYPDAQCVPVRTLSLQQPQQRPRPSVPKQDEPSPGSLSLGRSVPRLP